MTSQTGDTLLLDSVDDYLGPSAGRFFGSGYRRVGYVIGGTEFGLGHGPGTAGRPGVRARGGVSYPWDWSTKTEGDELRPHLTTLDALILAVRAAEFVARHTHGLDARQQARTWVRQVDIKAGSSAVEDGLGELAISAEHAASVPLGDGTGRVAATYDCRVAAMKARVELVHDDGAPVAAAGDLDAQLGPDYPGLYGTGFQEVHQTIRDVEVDVEAARADATVTVLPTGSPAGPSGGVESAHGPVASMVDSFSVALQLGQVLLYETDRMTRAESNTLWMRRTTITAGPAELRPAGAPFRETTTLEDSNLVTARGGLWRTAAIVGGTQGVTTRCLVTHRLPDRP